MGRRALTRTVVALAASLLLAPVAAAQSPRPGRDFGGVRNVLPGGQGETVNAFEFARVQATGEPPRSYVSQLPLYRDIVYAAPTLERSDLTRYFKSARFGPTGQATETSRPRPGVRIERDNFHVPHVYGRTRGDTMFGAGYASATDRLFFMDVLRHLGRARLSELIGPGEDNANLKADAEQLTIAPYTERDLEQMVVRTTRRYGAEGRRVHADLLAYVEGINQYIREARLDPRKLPVEYPALGELPEDWKPTDTVAIASLIGGIFGRGGGGEGRVAEVLREAQARFGRGDAGEVLADFRRENDPEAPVTTTRRFNFDEPSESDDRGAVVPDRDSQREVDVIKSGDQGPVGAPPSVGDLERLTRDGLDFTNSQSNALLVNRSRSRSGRPLAVMGPQVGYFSPEILLELDLHGPDIDARGAAFPGISMYVLLGRGQDFSWSATSSSSDNVDMFVERLCEPDGSAPSTDSDHYVYKGRCRPYQRIRRDFLITPKPSDPATTTPRRVELEVLRGVHGPVQKRATVNGRPVAIAEARSTLFNELDSAVAFKRLNSNEVHNARSFRRAMGKVNFVFNWFYADNRDVTYFSSGWIPRRAEGSDSSLPTSGSGAYDWKGFNPDGFTSRRLSFSEHPQDTNPSRGFLVSWNNKQAPGFRAADDNFSWGSVHRSEMLEDRIRRELRRGRSAASGAARGAARRRRSTDLTRLTQIVQLAATVDLRGQEILPLLRQVIGETGDPELDRALDILERWQRGGAHRRDLDRDNVYDESAAVALMDAWWLPLRAGIFERRLGTALYEQIVDINGYNEPGPRGSAFISGWYSYMDKDLRRLLGRDVRGPLSRRYCGGGSREQCRDVLVGTLRDAIRQVRERYGSLEAARVPATCEIEDPPNCDQIVFQTAGAVRTPPIPWQNRPTFQQVVEFSRHRPRAAQRRQGARRSPRFTG